MGRDLLCFAWFRREVISSTSAPLADSGALDDGERPNVRGSRRNGIVSDLFANHHSWLTRLIQQRSGSRSTAEDVASETFLQIVRLPALDVVEEPRAFLRTIATRILYKVWRRRDLERACIDTLSTLYGPDVHSSPEEAALLTEAIALIDQVLASLSAREREIFLRYRVERATYAEIGQTYDLSVSAVRRVVAKGLRLCLIAMEEE